MDPERWERIARLHAEALTRSGAERASFLDQAIGGDDGLRREITSLLDEEDGQSLLDAPMLASAAEILDVEMTLAPGTRLNQYEVEQLIGVGGMGEVYRAHDTKLGRRVALKLLPSDLAANADRVARLQHEAQILASLNHPSIGAIYGLEDGALVLELVEGPTLAERIAQRPIAIVDAVPIALQIAGAVRAAHERGIIHRDLKPANIKLRADGVVKVLDFGLASLTESSLPSSEAIAGTPPYLSPEQARGEAADRRSDIWAFGCVLYEMLTGQRAFGGGSVREILVNVQQTEPDWVALPRDTPASIRTLLDRALLKDRQRRIDDMSVAIYLLEDALQPAQPATKLNGLAPWWRPLAIGVSVLAALMFGGGLWWALNNRPAIATVPVRFEIAVPAAQGLAVNNTLSFAVSPNGDHVVYKVGSQSQLVLRALDDLTPRALAGAAGSSPFYSPDGHWIAFFSAGRLSKISAAEGSAIELCAIGAPQRGGVWLADDTILFATADRETGLMRVPSGGGKPEVLTTPDRSQGELDHWYPELLPGGRAALLTIVRGNPERFDVAVLDLETRRATVIVEGGSQAAFVDSGHLVYAAGGTLRAVGFDPKTLRVLTPPVPIVDEVMTHGNGLAQFATRGGTLIYLPAGSAAAPRRSVVWVDRQGREQSLGIPPRPFAAARLAPDERRIALDIGTTGFEHAIWLWDVPRQTLTPLNADPGDETQPVWTLDGRRLIFRSERGGSPNIYWQPSDGSGTAEPLFPTPRPQFPYSVSPDGTRLFVAQLSPPTQSDVGVLMLQDRRLELLIHTPFYEFGAEVSPDGRWLAYQSNESGRYEIYVRPLPDVARGRWQISTSGGTRPAWARHGRELYYIDAGDRVTAVPVQATGTTLGAGTPAAILPPQYVVNAPGTTYGRGYDVAADGRFLMIKDEDRADDRTQGSGPVVIHNWSEELRRVVPVR
jgi:Tol biopolymer transport system component